MRLNRLVLAGLILLAHVLPATAQNARVVPSCTLSASLPTRDAVGLMVDENGKLCTAGGGGGGGTVTQGTSPWVISCTSGANTSANPCFVQIATAIPSGGNVIGRVGIDQTSPGTTNRVSIGSDGTVAVNYYYDATGGSLGGSGFITPRTDRAGSTMAAERGSSDPLVGISATVTQSGTAVVGKGSAGNLYSAYAVNTTATAGYLACINAASAPAGGASISPVDVASIAGASGATAAINYGAGPPNAYSTGIVCLVTTSLTTYTAGGASFMQVRAR